MGRGFESRRSHQKIQEQLKLIQTGFSCSYIVSSLILLLIYEDIEKSVKHSSYPRYFEYRYPLMGIQYEYFSLIVVHVCQHYHVLEYLFHVHQ